MLQDMQGARSSRLKNAGVDESITDSAKAADNQVSGEKNSGRDRFKGETVSGTSGSRLIAAMVGSPEERNLVDAVSPMADMTEKVMMGEPPVKHEYPKKYDGSRFPADDPGSWPKGSKKKSTPSDDGYDKDLAKFNYAENRYLASVGGQKFEGKTTEQLESEMMAQRESLRSKGKWNDATNRPLPSKPNSDEVKQERKAPKPSPPNEDVLKESVPPEEGSSPAGAAKPPGKIDYAQRVRDASAALKEERRAQGIPPIAPSTKVVNNGALRAHMETGKVGNIMGDLPLNGSSTDASAMARQLRGTMSEMDPSLVGQFMGQANGYNGVVAAMNDPLRLTPEEKEKIAKAAVKRYMSGGDAGDSTNLAERFKEGSPIAVDSPYVQKDERWFERELAAEASGGPRLDMTMPEGSARAARIAKEKVAEKKRAKAAGEVPKDAPLTKKELATPEGRAEQKARQLREDRRAGKEKVIPVETDPVVLRARQRMEEKKLERTRRIKELEEQRAGAAIKKTEDKVIPVDNDPVAVRARKRMEDKKVEREERIKELDAQRAGSSVDPEMKDILKGLTNALMAFSSASKGGSVVSETRVARIPTARQPVAVGIS
jgi:hypothetical protein